MALHSLYRQNFGYFAFISSISKIPQSRQYFDFTCNGYSIFLSLFVWDHTAKQETVEILKYSIHDKFSSWLIVCFVSWADRILILLLIEEQAKLTKPNQNLSFYFSHPFCILNYSMSSIPVRFLLSLMLFASELQAKTNGSKTISLGSTIFPNVHPSSWVSASGLFAFGFYPEGNGFAIGIWLVGKPENTIVWTANRNRPPISSDSTLKLTKSGKLVLQTGQDNEIIANVSCSAASMLDSGNFVLYGKDFNVIWESFDSPTDTILGAQHLSVGVQLISSKSVSDHSSGRFCLQMQPEGNLVAYPVNNSVTMLGEDAYWASSNTDFFNFKEFILDFEGFFCLNSTNATFHNLDNGTALGKKTTIVYRATLENGGNFRLYKHLFGGNANSTVQLLWSALTSPCDAKGICGFNSYCSNKSDNAVCQCFPGFVACKDSSMFLECKQNISKDDCLSHTDTKMFYDVIPLDNMSWGDYPYYSWVSTTKEDCRKSCQEDCDCGAVIFDDGKCNKYKLPLRYGKIQSGSAVAFIKVPLGKSHPPINPTETEVHIDNKKKLILILVVTLGSISFLLLAFTMFVFFSYRHQVHTYSKLSENANLGFTKECSLRSFSFDELVSCTGGFTQEVGRGSFGAVYEGTIAGTNRRIAVKKLERVVEEGERKCQAEIAAVRTHHRNLVQLIGFCNNGSKKLLVYEYVSNGSLADLLFNTETRLSWKERLRIAQDVARGILYLHEECEVCIIHCNIKPQNILMDEAWTPKICDVGLARLWMQKHSGTRTGMEGTSGYVAPEWLKDESISVKVDIYSYGMLLLEILCRRRSIDLNLSSEEIFLSNWVYGHFVRGELNRVVPEDEDVDWRILERMMKIGLWCVQEDPSLRPSMKNVILMLEGLQDIPVPPSPFHVF